MDQGKEAGLGWHRAASQQPEQGQKSSDQGRWEDWQRVHDNSALAA